MLGLRVLVIELIKQLSNHTLGIIVVDGDSFVYKQKASNVGSVVGFYKLHLLRSSSINSWVVRWPSISVAKLWG